MNCEDGSEELSECIHLFKDENIAKKRSNELINGAGYAEILLYCSELTNGGSISFKFLKNINSINPI